MTRSFVVPGPPEKDPQRQWQGTVSKARGTAFEARLDESFAYYSAQGIAIVEKTPEPMRPVKNLGNGKFLAFFEKKAQPDYKGTLKGGRAVMFEAKFTATDRLEQKRVLPNQAEYLDNHQTLGALCYVVAGFASGAVYRVPWDIWRDMKARFGRKYVTETDLEPYRVATAQGGTLVLI